MLIFFRRHYTYTLLIISLLIMTLVFGTAYSFGVFFKPMIDEFGWTRAVTSGPYSVSMILYGLSSIVAGRASDRFNPKRVVILSGILLGTGCLLMSRINSLWHLYLFYGVMIGIGQGCTFIPLMALITRWFIRRRALVSGVVVAGVGLGIAIIPPIASWLSEMYSWRTSLLIIGIASTILIVSLAQFLKIDPDTTAQLSGTNHAITTGSSITKRDFSFPKVLNSKLFWMLCTAWLFYGLSIQVPAVHTVAYATDLGMSAIGAATLFTAIGIVGIFGRIAMGFAGEKIRGEIIVTTGFLLVSMAYFGLVASNTTWMLFLFSVVYGFFSGMGLLLTSIVANLFGLSSLGAISGSVLFTWSVGAAVGPLIAGHIFDTATSYNPAFLLCGIIAALAGLIMFLLKLKQ